MTHLITNSNHTSHREFMDILLDSKPIKIVPYFTPDLFGKESPILTHLSQPSLNLQIVLITTYKRKYTGPVYLSNKPVLTFPNTVNLFIHILSFKIY